MFPNLVNFFHSTIFNITVISSTAYFCVLFTLRMVLLVHLEIIVALVQFYLFIQETLLNNKNDRRRGLHC